MLDLDISFYCVIDVYIQRRGFMLMSTSTQKYYRAEVRLSALVLGVTELYYRVHTLMLVLVADIYNYIRLRGLIRITL
jgi:hypothetical protein